MGPCCGILMPSGTMYAQSMIVLLLCTLASAQEGPEQLSSLEKGLIGAGAGVLLIAAGILAYSIWRRCKTHGGRFSMQSSSIHELEPQPTNLAGAYDSIIITKKRQAGATVSVAGRIPSDVERGIQAHYGLPGTVDPTADSPESTEPGNSQGNMQRAVVFEDLTGSEQQCLRAANIRDSVIITRDRRNCAAVGDRETEEPEDNNLSVSSGVLLCGGSAVQCKSVGDYSNILPGYLDGQLEEARASPSVPRVHLALPKYGTTYVS